MVKLLLKNRWQEAEKEPDDKNFFIQKMPSDFLEALRLSMNYGFVTKEEIWDWALTSIKVSDNYDPILLELTSGKEADGRQIDYSIRRRTENEKTDKPSEFS